MDDWRAGRSVPGPARGFRPYSARDLDRLTSRAGLDASDRLAVRAVAAVLPFRANEYVIESLIDWAAAPDDPVYRLVFPQPDMLPAGDIALIADLIAHRAPAREVRAAARLVRMRMTQGGTGPLVPGVPPAGDEPLPGVQHQYPGTVVVFPRQGQACHAYCTFCFRWAEFTGDPDLTIATSAVSAITRYLRAHQEVSSVVLTGGDPMIMSAQVMRRYIEPLLDAELGHIESIAIETKALAWWPYRFLTDPDADSVLGLFELAAAAGKSLAVMAHFTHPRELEPPAVTAAVRRITAAGGTVRTQAPLVRGINDDWRTWAAMWRTEARLGMIPYLMLVEHDAGPGGYFAVPLARAADIYRDAYSSVSGLCRTVRGPCMPATPGKVSIDGTAELAGQKVFVLRMLETRDPALTGQQFVACFDPDATWLTDLRPAPGTRFPFTDPSPPHPPGAQESRTVQPDKSLIRSPVPADDLASPFIGRTSDQDRNGLRGDVLA